MGFLEYTQQSRLEKLLSAASTCCSGSTTVTILQVKVDAKGHGEFRTDAAKHHAESSTDLSDIDLVRKLDEQGLRKYLDLSGIVAGEKQAHSTAKPRGASLRVL